MSQMNGFVVPRSRAVSEISIIRAMPGHLIHEARMLPVEFRWCFIMSFVPGHRQSVACRVQIVIILSFVYCAATVMG